MMFIFFFCDEYFHISCNSLYAGEDKDNFYLDTSTEEEILNFFLISYFAYGSFNMPFP